MATKATINNIKKEIMNRISSNVTTVQDVSDYEKSPVDGFPAVNVTLADHDNEYESNAENMRIWNFNIRVIQLIGSGDALPNDRKQTAERILGNAVSEIVNSFDEYYELGSEVNYTRAAIGNMGYIETPQGWCRTCNITIGCAKSYTIR